MARNFALDTNAAREANAGGKRITETGKYIGTIVAAFYEKNEKGTESFNVMFASDGGQEAGPLSIYTHNGSGQELSGYKLVNALMTCCKVKQLTASPAPVELFDWQSSSMVTKTKDVYTELKNKKVGLVLQQEEYTKQDLIIGIRMIIAAPFDAATELMAAEILDKQTQPKQLEKYMQYIAQNPVRRQKKKAVDPRAATSSFQAPAGGADFMDDDIPF